MTIIFRVYNEMINIIKKYSNHIAVFFIAFLFF